MEELKTIFKKPAVRIVLNAILSTLVAIFSGAIFGDKERITMWIILTVAVAVIYIGVLIAYANCDKNLNEINEKLKDEIEVWKTSSRVYNSAIQGLSTLCKMSAKSANIQINEIINEGRINCSVWNFDIASNLTCLEIYNCIINNLGIKTANGVVDVEVCFVKLFETGRNKQKHKYANLCAYYNPTNSTPAIYKVNRDVSAKNIYYDAQMFIRNNAAPSILLNKEEIKKSFYLKRNHPCEYSQYIGIPVFCDTTNGGKMIGLLEIVCKNDCILANDRNKIEDYINRFFTPYAQLLLLLYKIEKALKATPKRKGGNI